MGSAFCVILHSHPNVFWRVFFIDVSGKGSVSDADPLSGLVGRQAAMPDQVQQFVACHVRVLLGSGVTVTYRFP